MRTVPLGLVFFAWCTLMAVAPLRRPRRLALMSWALGMVPSELPLALLLIVLASTIPEYVTGVPGGLSAWIALGVFALTVIGLAVVVGRCLRSGPVLDRAMTVALGPAWRSEVDARLARRWRRRRPWLRILLMPWPFRPREVERAADIRYGDGRSHLLDVYRHRSHPSAAPTFVYLHGGRFRWGRKSWEARPLLHRLASQGWTCISANYHKSRTPAEGFPQHLIDVKRVIAWIRTTGPEHGADPERIFLAGSSAGAHLTAMAALTANDPTFQPGFETADTSITAGIGLYGYYGPLGGDEEPASSPGAYVRPGAPPMFVIHGDHDTYTPVEGARSFVDAQRAVATNPVVFAELPGAQHSFDMFHSIRFETVVDAIEAFTGWVRTQCGPSPQCADQHVRHTHRFGDVGR